MAKDWNVGKKEEGKGLEKVPEVAVMIGVITKFQTEEQMAEYLDELEFLAGTLDIEILNRFSQRLESPDSKTFVGKGKLEEIDAFV